ncbi:MAG: leucine-rich repeat protein [Clostridia bacterium]|nr:leucine-rich repeat protein [Clostridia bacterium]
MEYCDKYGLIDSINNLGYSVDIPDQAEIVFVDYSDWFHMLTADETGRFHVVVSVKIEYRTVRDGNAESTYLGLTFVSPSGEVHLISAEPEPTVEETGPSEGLTYASNGDGTCSVTGIGTFEGSRLEIPDTSSEGDTVTAVADGAFRQSQIEYLKIPDTVKTIGMNAFAGCSLSKIDLGKGVAYIGVCAFNYNQYLTSLVIPDSVKTIDDGAFCWCTRLKNVSIGNGLITLERQAFAYSPGVHYTEYENGLYLGNRSNPYSVLIDVADDTCASIAIHPDTKTLGFGAFSGCSNLTSVILPAGLTSIGKYAFNCCFSLTEITIPATVTTIGIEAFNTCPSLTAVTFEYDGEWTLRYPEDWIERDPDTFGVEITFTSGTPEENAHDLTYSYIHQSWTKN